MTRLSAHILTFGLTAVVSANGPQAAGYTMEDPERAKLRRIILKLRSILQRVEEPGRLFCGDPREVQQLKRLIWSAEFAYANGKPFKTSPP